MRALFVCHQNRCRSRVAEDVFQVLTWSVDGRSDYQGRSAGTKADARGHQITARDVEWADVICVMEQEQEAHIRKRWPAQADKIRVLGIPDIYQPHDETLRSLLTEVVRTLLADELPGRATVDAAPPRKLRPRSGGFRWWNVVWAGRSAGAIAALVAVMAIAGYLIGSRAQPEHPVSIAPASSGPSRSVAPDATVDSGTPDPRYIPSDRTGSAAPGPNGPTGPVSSAAPGESPMRAGDSLDTRSANFGPMPPRPSVTPPPERPRPPVALPPPAPPAPPTAVTGESSGRLAPAAESTGAAAEVVGPRPPAVGGRGRDAASREGADGTDPGAIIDWMLREYPARR